MDTEALSRTLARNLAAVRERIARAEARAGRPPGSCRLIAVTKTVGADEIAALFSLGQKDFGENRVQDLVAKKQALASRGLAGAEGPRFHMIGHLQRNKVGRFLRSGAALHALDSERLAEAIERALEGASAPLEAFVEVNVSGESSKGGLAPADLPEFLARRRARGRIAPRGLMTMAPLDAPGDRARPFFRALRELAEKAGLCELSMGMTQDFEVAVEEGATVVRIGSALFA
jgi:pyridoxal phosphate enzyme (YggS family)